MNRLHQALFGIWLAGAAVADPLPKLASGSIQRIEHFPSKFVEPRTVDVWLPDGYSAAKRYSVIYMHDGQMLFDPLLTWNKKAWQVDQTVGRLIREQRIPDTIVIGIWNSGAYRFSEYFPEKFLPTVTESFRRTYIDSYLKGKPQSDNYLRFIVQELKPYIDTHYPTRPERQNTFIVGSSMGGMISVYAMNEYPEVFGGAAGMSIAWISQDTPNFELPLAAFNYLQRHLAPPAGHRLYMDHGTTEMDRWYDPYQAFVDEIVRDQGYTAENWRSRRIEGTGHNELDWSNRLDSVLEFLMAPTAR